MNPSVTPAWPQPSPPSDFLFRDWLNAAPHVPFRPVYRIEAHARPGRTASTLEKLSRIEFVFRVTNTFVATVSCHEGKIVPPVSLRAESFGFRLTAMPGPEGLIPSDAALAQLESFLGQQSPEFRTALVDELEQPAAATAAAVVKLFRRVPWQSLRLEQRFAAGVVEPIYRFRKAVGRAEFCVGARSGDVQVRLGSRAP